MNLSNPQHPLQRLYKAKLTLLATWSTVIGLAVLILARWADSAADSGWLQILPLGEIGATLFATGLIVVAWTYIDKKDGDERAREQFREVIHEEAPSIRDAVVNGFAFEPDTLTNVASPATLDRVVENCLAIRLGDKALATDIYTDIREQVIRADERRRDVEVSVALAPWAHGPASGNGAMFVATITWEYRLVPRSTVMRFACVSDLDDYADLLQDPSSTIAWYFQPIGKLDGASKEVFELVHFAVDGRPRPARRTTRAGTQIFTVNLGTTAEPGSEELTITYTCRCLVQQHGHLLHLDIAQPTKGLKIRFSYGDCGIRRVNVVDYIASTGQPRITRLSASDPSPSIEIAYDDWVYPKAGVGFVWVLAREMVSTRKNAANK